MRDRVLHPCQVLKVKVYMHFVYTFPSSCFLIKEKKLETLEMGSSGKKHPLSGSCTELNAVHNFVIAFLM